MINHYNYTVSILSYNTLFSKHSLAVQHLINFTAFSMLAKQRKLLLHRTGVRKGVLDKKRERKKEKKKEEKTNKNIRFRS